MAELKPFRVASYNIHKCVGIDGRFDIARVARVIRDLEADVLGLQEVDSSFGPGSDSMQLDYLAETTGMRAVGGPTILRHDGYYGNALLTRCKILEVRRYDLSFPGRESRGALDVELDYWGLTVRVIVTHLGLRPAERRYQVKRLLEFIAEYAHRPLIVLGDLNEWFLLGRPARWLHRFFGQIPAPRTFPSLLPLFALDRILVSPQQAILKMGTLDTPESRVASDHLPLQALLDFS